MADFTEKSKFSWAVVSVIAVCGLAVGGFAARGENTRDLAAENKTKIDATTAALNAVRLELAGVSAKLDLLLQRGNVQSAGHHQ